MKTTQQVSVLKQTEFISLLGKYINQGCISRIDRILSLIHPMLPFYKNAAFISKKYFESRYEANSSAQKIVIPEYLGQNKIAGKIATYINTNLKNEVYLSLVHGSIATNEEIAYSDFDALVILRDTVFNSHKKLIHAAMHLSKCYSMMIEFDPLQHHGWFVMSQSDLKQYPFNYFPLQILPFSGILTGQSEISILIDDRPHKQMMLNHLTASLKRQLIQGYIPSNYYNAKSILSEFMLLPSLFIQIKTGDGVFKKFSFELTSKFFTSEEYKVMNEVSQIRTLWKIPATKTLFDSPTLVTPHLKKIQKRQSGKITSELEVLFANGLGDRMIAFINTLERKINEK